MILLTREQFDEAACAIIERKAEAFLEEAGVFWETDIDKVLNYLGGESGATVYTTTMENENLRMPDWVLAIDPSLQGDLIDHIYLIIPGEFELQINGNAVRVVSA